MTHRARIPAGLVVLMLLSGCLGPVAGVYPPAPGQATQNIYIVNHGWHTGLVVQKDRLAALGLLPDEHFQNSDYVEIGWGDEGFYRAERITSGIAVRAVFWPTPTVLHIVAMDKPVEQFFAYSGIIEVELSEEGFSRLRTFITSSYRRDDDANIIDLGPGIYGASRFYRANGHYYFPNTCNKWTARALRSAGCPITPFYAIRAINVFNQTAKFGSMMREFTE